MRLLMCAMLVNASGICAATQDQLNANAQTSAVDATKEQPCDGNCKTIAKVLAASVAGIGTGLLAGTAKSMISSRGTQPLFDRAATATTVGGVTAYYGHQGIENYFGKHYTSLYLAVALGSGIVFSVVA